MKKIIFVLTTLSLSFGFTGCHKQDTPFYKGIFTEGGHGGGCPNTVIITKSIQDGLAINTIIKVNFSDTTQVQQLQTGEKIEFRILSYYPDTNTYLAICFIPQYDAIIKLSH